MPDITAADYVTQVVQTPHAVDAHAWNQLLAQESQATPFMHLHYLAALHDSASATALTGWTPHFFLLWQGGQLQAACVLYVKSHSYGEYVFDWAWANAYQQHGLAYYPKAVVAVPFTPVPGARLLARSSRARLALVQTLLAWCRAQQLSSLHILFASTQDQAACRAAGLQLRQGLQFHWTNRVPANDPRNNDNNLTGERFRDFTHFLACLQRDKRKKIQQERRRVADAGVRFRWARGVDITTADWDFFYRCYTRTYQEHGNPPYLNRAFFAAMAATLPQAWLLFIAERQSQPIAASLIALSFAPDGEPQAPTAIPTSAYGRYWGALERVDGLHFEACYYQPLSWCMAQGVTRFEGGAQGEHKIARGLLPAATTSAHWLAHPGFAQAVAQFLQRETHSLQASCQALMQRNPYKTSLQPALADPAPDQAADEV